MTVKPASNRAGRITSGDARAFFPRAKYSYEKLKIETGLDWISFEIQM
jgi:hypothetical protein